MVTYNGIFWAFLLKQRKVFIKTEYIVSFVSSLYDFSTSSIVIYSSPTYIIIPGVTSIPAIESIYTSSTTTLFGTILIYVPEELPKSLIKNLSYSKVIFE